MQDAYENAVGEMGDREPSLLLVFMTANVDHAKALERLNEITKGEIPYSGKVCNLHKGASIYDVRRGWGEGGPPKADERNKIS